MVSDLKAVKCEAVNNLEQFLSILRVRAVGSTGQRCYPLLVVN